MTCQSGGRGSRCAGMVVCDCTWWSMDVVVVLDVVADDTVVLGLGVRAWWSTTVYGGLWM